MKKMKIFYTLIVVLLCNFNSLAQQADVVWGEKIKTKRMAGIIGGNEKNYYTTHYGKDKQLIFRKYNQSMKLEKEQTIPFELDEKRYFYNKTIFLKNKIVHLISERKKKEKKTYLYASTTDLDLNVIGKTLILDEGEVTSSGGGLFSMQDYNSNAFGITAISPDSTKLLVYREKPTKRNEPTKMSLKVYDSDLTTMLFNKDVDLPIKDRNFNVSEIEIDNYGNIYVLALIYKESKEVKRGQTDSYYKLIAFERGSGKPKQFDFDFQGDDIMTIEIEHGANNTLVCTGFLSDIKKGLLSTSTSNVSDEFFITNIDCSNFSILSKIRTKVKELYPERKKREDYVPYTIRNVYSKPDGSYTVVAEQYKLEVRTATDSRGRSYTTYRYFYCDIACMNVDAAGNLKSISKIPKYQLNADNPSIQSTYYNGNVYIIYEDLARNAQANTDKEIKRSSGSGGSKDGLFLITVLPDGQVKKDLIYDYKQTKIQPYIMFSRKITSNIILLNAKDQIGKIEFK
jgi:hypothetical protein